MFLYIYIYMDMSGYVVTTPFFLSITEILIKRFLLKKKERIQISVINKYFFKNFEVFSQELEVK